MSFLMFLTSVGFSINVGHCNMMDSDSEAKKSCMQIDDDGSKECPPGCCDFEQLTFEGIDYDYVQATFYANEDTEGPVFALSSDQPQFLIQASNYPGHENNHSPPLIARDIPILFQSFLL